ncbi:MULTISPECIES: signal recognition particle-docking protein FtsY [Staphylococcus]|jgi:fused signal recognition particle receptor|uniref:Signal recognition particle receptor FtsY n=1 Tax=Staphylococcus nepalensis TaxID=214473 RepID=A0A291JKS8_9STAP|nr:MULTISPECIES: signal recognition particle-docking protein FtsY [Staphylococcus]ATH60339.1 signal recognition particle-docking protein FtsY [Staphylococcus nepalensis]ATH65388.1 signal recognition particle-docking protein FtsY [Staphylococcus nepalensis]AWI44757.1 signal recognition particle-docking protein FtsY [Staphylococcus nepalensis]MBO1204733.1 signal recognition particle-docking protein FtsY [Staphylococcus nepalensis]MDW8551411.1 signal recognition particle-docking protein FtsY [Sta
MSFFKRLKDKFTSSTEKHNQDELNEAQQSELDVEQSQVSEEPQEKNKKPKKLKEADFDDDGLISIEDFEEIEAQQLGAKFRAGLEKSRENFQEQLNNLIARYRKVDEDFFEALEEMLITADVGFNTVMELVEELRTEAQRRNISETEDLREVIVEKIVEIYHQDDEHSEIMNIENEGLNVILMVGVNGVGKTTTIGKLAHRYQAEGKKVMLAAGDTFRAGAIEQLKIWGDRVGVEVMSQKEGSDPAAVMYDAINAAKSKGVDILICDTAGRLQNKSNLMNELEKVKRVIGRAVPEAPHEVLLCLDATTGQNALSQAKSFKEVTNVTGIVLTKLDGTAKGGIVLAIRNELKIPVKYVGLGEKLDDLQPFNPESYVYGLFADMIEQNVDSSDKSEDHSDNSNEQNEGHTDEPK